ncbi:MAG TPA: hypothetical protein VES42_03155 [Pilimelia sp.]|nr:hypothetical protein [Pilimelia sp.]
MTWAVLVTLASGVLVGFVPAYLLERRRERHTLGTRWDTPLFTLSVEFISASQHFGHAAGRIPGAEPADRAAVAARAAEEQQKMRSLQIQLRLLGDVRVQRAARMVIRHAWAVMRVAQGDEDPRAAEYAGVPPHTRLSDALHDFIRASRAQLRVNDPETIATDEPADWPDLPEGRPLPLRLLMPWR